MSSNESCTLSKARCLRARAFVLSDFSSCSLTSIKVIYNIVCNVIDYFLLIQIMPITYIIGDATDPPRNNPGIIVHVCNDIGQWGRGFVLAVSQRWKQPEHEYRAWAKGDGPIPFELGQVQLVQVEDNLWVANLIGQRDIRRYQGTAPVRYEAIQQELRFVAAQAAGSGTAVHMPRIGCGLAGGTWDKIEPIVQAELADKGVPVFVYDLMSV